MSLSTFAFAMVRVVLAVVAAGVAGHWSARALGYGADGVGRLAAVVMGVSVVLVCAEVLGVVGELRAVPLIAVLIVVAAGAWTWAARGRVRDSSAADRAKKSPVTAPPADRGLQGEARPAVARRLRLARIWTLVAVSVIGGQWALATADSYGGGMFNFDTLWYHMPFAAGYALGGSIAGVELDAGRSVGGVLPGQLRACARGRDRAAARRCALAARQCRVARRAAARRLMAGRPWQVEAETLVAGYLVPVAQYWLHPARGGLQRHRGTRHARGCQQRSSSIATPGCPRSLSASRSAGPPGGRPFLVPVLVVLLGVASRALESRAPARTVRRSEASATRAARHDDPCRCGRGRLGGTSTTSCSWAIRSGRDFRLGRSCYPAHARRWPPPPSRLCSPSCATCRCGDRGSFPA